MTPGEHNVRFDLRVEGYVGVLASGSFVYVKGAERVKYGWNLNSYKEGMKDAATEGWEWVNYSEAIKDNVYKNLPNAIPSDQSLIWSQAKANGLYESVLRYTAEDGSYEEAKMDSFGL